VPFSDKTHDFCGSRGARRMAETTVCLVDNSLADVHLMNFDRLLSDYRLIG